MSEYAQVEEFVRNEVAAITGKPVESVTPTTVLVGGGRVVDSADLVMLLLRQEEQIPAYAEVTTLGKQWHSEWVSRAFAPWLDLLTGAPRDRLHGQLVAMCDVYVWYLLRRQQGLSRRQTHLALAELLNGVLR